LSLIKYFNYFCVTACVASNTLLFKKYGEQGGYCVTTNKQGTIAAIPDPGIVDAKMQFIILNLSFVPFLIN
jgi:hypothetical protein